MIEPTYDSRQTGYRYTVTTKVDGHVIGEFRHRIPDPFVRQTVHIGLWDLLRGLRRRTLTVEVIVGGDADIVDNILDLDANNLNPPRRIGFDAAIHRTLRGFLHG